MNKAKCIMVQGTMSGAGKSLLCTALCRIFAQDGYRVAPFKSQNMALNSFVTRSGLEMGRAQVVQAQAAGAEPDVRMNPILLKPSSDVGSQVIVNGEVRGQMSAADYFRMKRSLIPEILAAYHSLAAENDIIVIEGAGSPAEINLKADDIVNMGLAKLVDAPVLLAGDIDRGGVFAQLVGTQAVQNVLAGERYKNVGAEIKAYCRGEYGRTPAPIDPEVRAKILGEEKPIEGRYADSLPTDTFEKTAEKLGDTAKCEEDVLSYIAFPAVAEKFFDNRRAEEEKKVRYSIEAL